MDATPDPSADPPVCPLCLRPIPPGTRASTHHLTPKLKGGARGPAVLMHHICHAEIHARLTEAEIAREAATPEALRAIGPAAEQLAQSESLEAHGLSVTARLNRLNG